MSAPVPDSVTIDLLDGRTVTVDRLGVVLVTGPGQPWPVQFTLPARLTDVPGTPLLITPERAA